MDFRESRNGLERFGGGRKWFAVLAIASMSVLAALSLAGIRTSSFVGAQKVIPNSKQPAASDSSLLAPQALELSPSSGVEAEAKGGKIAFLFLARQNLAHEELWRSWLAGNEDRYILLIHCDQSDLSSTSEWFNQHRAKSPVVPTQWGHQNLTKAWNVLVKEALENEHVQRIVYLCGKSVPIQTFDHVYKALFASRSAWFDTMHIDEHLRWGLKYKAQCWVSFPRYVGKELVSGGHFERLQQMIDANKIPWNVLTDEFYPSQVANDAKLYQRDWNRSPMWTWWHPGASSPREVHTLNDEYLESLQQAKRCGVLFARKFGPHSNIAQYALHSTPLELEKDSDFPLHPFVPSLTEMPYAKNIRQLKPCEYEPGATC